MLRKICIRLQKTSTVFVMYLSAVVLLCISAVTPVKASEKPEYSIILVNSFNESDFEVKMMYRLMNNISDDENILVLTVPAFYADSVAGLSPSVKQTVLNNFLIQVDSFIQNQQQVRFSRIVAIGRHASVFVDTNPTLLPEAERFYLHIDWRPSVGTLIPSDYEPQASYQQIVTAFPNASEILFIHGSKLLPQDDGLINNFLTQAPQGIKVRYYNPMQQPDKTLAALQALSQPTPIIYINYKYFERNWEPVHTWLVNQNRHPIFTIFSHNVERYTGGAVVVPEKLADAAVALAQGQNLSVTSNPVISLQYNAQQLAKWGIKSSALVDGAELVNTAPSVVEADTVLKIVIFFLLIITFMTFIMLRKTRANEVQMAEALAMADKANTSKSEFLANMSHEIRTPMNGVLGTLQILERSSTDQQNREMIAKASYSAKYLLTIINDILDYSKIEANKLSLENKPFSMLEVVESLHSDLSIAASEKNIEFVTEVDDNFKDGWRGDVVRVRQIILNLASNAVKFTEQGTVRIKLYATTNDSKQSCVCVDVIDSGIGMSQQAQEKIFERFTQADSSTTRKFGGTGLGMSITVSLIEMMHGTLELHSEEGKGTHVKVSLPLAKATLKKGRTNTEQVDVPQLSNKRILIAEDNKINQLIVTTMLKPTGAELEVVEDGEKAVQAFKENEYDLVLMDIQMPVMDGLEAYLLIKELNPSTPVVALTANVMKDEIARYLDIGFAAHIGKPIDLDTLYQTVQVNL